MVGGTGNNSFLSDIVSSSRRVFETIDAVTPIWTRPVSQAPNVNGQRTAPLVDTTRAETNNALQQYGPIIAVVGIGLVFYLLAKGN